MRRNLALTTESARHPFRLNLPEPTLKMPPASKLDLLLAAFKTWLACFAATIIFLS